MRYLAPPPQALIRRMTGGSSRGRFVAFSEAACGGDLLNMKWS